MKIAVVEITAASVKRNMDGLAGGSEPAVTSPIRLPAHWFFSAFRMISIALMTVMSRCALQYTMTL